MYPKKELAQLIISSCDFYGVDHVVISPGSRNAPLTVGFSNSSNFNCLSVVDERCAAFFALGIAQQRRIPVALVCTSGSALLNYYPAIAEAFYSKIPLIVISADRPKHLIDIGDGQTIRQENVYKNHIGFSANLEVDKQLDYNKSLVSQAIKIAFSQSLPVHINVPFEEPLYETVSKLNSFEFDQFPILSENQFEVPDALIDIWNSSKRKMILVGVNYPSQNLQEVLNHFAKDESVLILTETTSNLNHSNFINSIDKLITKLNTNDFGSLQPEVLLTFGGFVVSKRIKIFLREFSPKHHWHIDNQTKLDTFFCLSQHIKQDPFVFLSKMISQVKMKENVSYQKFWISEKYKRDIKHEEFIKKTEYSDLKVIANILGSIPDNSLLQLSNSSVVRYVQLFNLNKTLRVFCNRGTSGIDGSTSTAIGASFAQQNQTVLITGDLSFFYDSNALWNSYVPKTFRVIILNNDGGGIFKIIPGPKSTNTLPFFETKHGLKANHLAKMFGFEYTKVSDLEGLDKSLETFYNYSDKPKILEIITPSDINDVVLQDYFNYL